MRVIRCLMVKTGTYNDVAARPYQTQFDTHKLNQFQEVTQGGRYVSGSTLAGVAGGMLRPTAEAEGIVGIENGWDTPRLRFLMEVEYSSDIMGAGQRQFMSGYTDYVGVSANHAVDPKMRLFFNSSVTVRNTVEMTPVGRQTIGRVMDSSHILRSTELQPLTSGLGAPGVPGQNPMMGSSMFRGPGLSQFGQPSPTLMRPQDVFSSMSTRVLDDADILDYRTMAMGPSKSRRSNGSAPDYLSRTLKAYSAARAHDDVYQGDFADVMEEARGQVQESPVTQDLWLHQLSRATQFGDTMSVTWGELCSMDPNIDGVAQIILGDSGNGMGPVSTRGNSEYWTTSTMQTIAATILSNSVPSLLMDLMMTQVDFMATNQTLGGADPFDIKILHAQGFAQNLDLTPYLQRFEGRLITEVLRDLTSNNAIDINLRMSVDILGETTIDLEMNGEPSIRYVMPSFCDALAAPVMTMNPDRLRDLSSDLSSLYENLDVPHHDANSFNNVGFGGPNETGSTL